MPVPFTNQSTKEIAAAINSKAVLLRDGASVEERDLVASLVRQAVEATKPTIKSVLVTPPIAAILWLDHNHYNRDWNPKTSAAYAAMMTADLWRLTSQSVYALSRDAGDLLDGSHRAAAQVYAETSLDMFICLGMSKNDISALDCGKKRHAYDVCKLLGVANAKDKQTVLIEMWNYLAKIEVISDAVNEANINGIAAKIQQHDALLTRALEIGAATVTDADDALVGKIIAARIAAILLHSGWDQDRIIDYLSEIQTGEFDSETTPLWHADNRVRSHKQPETVWRTPKQIAIIIKAMMMEVDGVQITSARQSASRQLDAAATDWPDPRIEFPQPGSQEEEETDAREPADAAREPADA